MTLPRSSATVLCIVAAALSLGLLLWTGRGGAGANGFLAILALWTLAPYALLAGLTRVATGAFWQGLLAVAAIALGVLWVAVYRDAILAHPDAQGGVVFIALPLVQFAIVAGLWILFFVARVASRAAKRH